MLIVARPVAKSTQAEAMDGRGFYITFYSIYSISCQRHGWRQGGEGRSMQNWALMRVTRAF